MFLLDTNVVSELMRLEPARTVESWIAAQVPEELFLSAVSEAELRYAVAILPVGHRREALFSRMEGMLRRAFGDRVLPFDREAACVYAEMAAMRRARGLHPDPIDCQIAAIARLGGLTVVTRNVGDFEGLGIGLHNPWETGSLMSVAEEGEG